MRFLFKAFDATEFQRTVEDGRIRHLGLRIFGSVIEASDATIEHPASTMSIYLDAPDRDALFEKAIDAGEAPRYFRFRICPTVGVRAGFSTQMKTPGELQRN